MSRLPHTFVVFGLVALLACISACRDDASSQKPRFVVFAPHGYIRVQDASPADPAKLLDAINQSAKSENWTRQSMEAWGLDGHERVAYRFLDDAENEILVDWVYQENDDLLVLVSATPDVRESASTAIWSKLMPQLIH